MLIEFINKIKTASNSNIEKFSENLKGLFLIKTDISKFNKIPIIKNISGILKIVVMI